MQCPTCGNDTPGTLGKCSHCEAPIDVYSVGPVVPLSAPPPAPAWAPESPPPVTPEFTMPPQAPAQQTAPEPPGASQPLLRLSAEPAAPPSPPPAPPMPPSSSMPSGPLTPPAQQTPTPPGTPLPPIDLEDTAAWTFNPEDDEPSGGFSAPPPSPSPSPWWNAQPAPPTPAAGPADAATSAFALETPPERTESIVPDSWFAKPRRPDPSDTDATRIASGPGTMHPGTTGEHPAPMGFGFNPDQTRMDPGASPMGAPPSLGLAPTGTGPIGPGVMGQAVMGQGPLGPGTPVEPGRQGGGGPSKPLLVAVAALVTIAVGSVVFVAWPSGGGSSEGAEPTPSSSNQQVAQKNPLAEATKGQAAAMNTLLNDSVDTRRILAGALGRAGKCQTLPQAIQGFQTVAQRRQNQLNRTRNLQLDKLANSERLRTSLTQALTASLQVDQVLLRWAQQNQRDCRGKPRPSAAQVPGRAAIERRATSAKKRFVVLWNPVALKTGQPQRSWRRV